MRLFISQMFCRDVDLDNPETYSYLPDSISVLRDMMFAHIGYYHCYINHWHKDWFHNGNNGQKTRVEKLIENFTENESEHYYDVRWYQEQIFLFEEETENMC